MALNRRVAIIGSGLVGRSWAAVFAGGGFDVALYDAAPGVADQARELVSDALEELSAHGLVKDAKAAAARVRAATSLLDALDGAGFVQESSPETLGAKRTVFAELDRLAAPETEATRKLKNPGAETRRGNEEDCPPTPRLWRACLLARRSFSEGGCAV